MVQDPQKVDTQTPGNTNPSQYGITSQPVPLNNNPSQQPFVNNNNSSQQQQQSQPQGSFSVSQKSSYYTKQLNDSDPTAPPPDYDEFFSSGFNSTLALYDEASAPGRGQINGSMQNSDQMGKNNHNNGSNNVIFDESQHSDMQSTQNDAKRGQYLQKNQQDQQNQGRNGLGKRFGMVFPMIRINCKSFNLITWVVFLFTLPLSLLISAIKSIGVGVREMMWRNQMQNDNNNKERAKKIAISNQNYYSIAKSTTTNNVNNTKNNTNNNTKNSDNTSNTPIDPQDYTHRYDILYSALKKSAYNQYYSNWNNYIAQKHQSELHDWEVECKKIEKMNKPGLISSLFGRKKEQLPYPNRPELLESSENRRLHKLNALEIQSLRGLAVLEGVNALDDRELVGKTYYHSAQSTGSTSITSTTMTSPSPLIATTYNSVLDRKEYELSKGKGFFGWIDNGGMEALVFINFIVVFLFWLSDLSAATSFLILGAITLCIVGLIFMFFIGVMLALEGLKTGVMLTSIFTFLWWIIDPAKSDKKSGRCCGRIADKWKEDREKLNRYKR